MFPVDSHYNFFNSYERKKILQIRNLHLHKKKEVVKEAFINYFSFLIATGLNIKISSNSNSSYVFEN